MPTIPPSSIATPDGDMPAYEALPTGDAKGGIVVVQEAFGVTPHIEGIVRRLADAGWYAVAPAFFHRQGSPVFSYDDVASARPVMEQLSADGLGMDLAAAVSHLETQGYAAERRGVVGFCMGGSVSFYAAASQPLGAAVTFYGGGVVQGRFGMPSLVDLAPSLRTPWLGLFGDLDQGIPPEHVEQLRAAVAQAPVPTEIVRYADAQHGFNCDDRPAAYNPEAATDAWSRTLSFFDSHLGS
jgi:carboxymethylenebutenolidase